jgi:UDP-N-acetylmuramoyl-tripeptide--D-alanyl-D-alanine ligase
MIEKLYNTFLSNSVISTDTRKIKKNCLFFALKGPNYNANRFASKALENGAAYAVIDEKKFAIDNRYIIVDNVLESLQELAKYHRSKLTCIILAITGTNGKTTSKELCQKVLQKKYRTSATVGNLNNHIGVPLSILSIDRKDEFAIIEMGASQKGDIDILCQIAQPSMGIITNIGKAHLEGFGSLGGVLNTKTELYRYLAHDSLPVFIKDNQDLLNSKLPINCPKLNYGELNSSIFQINMLGAQPYCLVSVGKEKIQSKIIGDFNFDNIALAIAVGLNFGVQLNDIKVAIESYTPRNNRSQIIQSKKNTILLDAYNSNPMSIESAISNLIKISNIKKAMILGDMHELGNESEKEHHTLINICQKSGIKNVIFVGETLHRLNQTDFASFAKRNELIDYLKKNAFSDTFILIKGSRSLELEKITKYL